MNIKRSSKNQRKPGEGFKGDGCETGEVGWTKSGTAKMLMLKVVLKILEILFYLYYNLHCLIIILLMYYSPDNGQLGCYITNL